MKTNVALIGARGVGKSKLSRRLKKLSNHPVMSSDALIPYEYGGLSVAEIVARIGWEGFREKEYEILKKISDMKNVIIDCGGGIVVDITVPQEKFLKDKFFGKENGLREFYSKRKIKLLKKNSYIVYLQRQSSWLVQKNQPSADRPKLHDDYKKLLKKRLAFYKKAADLTIDLDKYSLDRAADIIYAKYLG